MARSELDLRAQLQESLELAYVSTDDIVVGLGLRSIQIGIHHADSDHYEPVVIDPLVLIVYRLYTLIGHGAADDEQHYEGNSGNFGTPGPQP